MFRIFLIFIFYLYCFTLKSGPLDIEDIKNKCLDEFKIENSEEYTKCIKEEVNNNLYNDSHAE